MTDDTRKLLKLFGVAVTDFETEAEKLAGRAAQLAPASKEEVLALLRDSTELCRELNARWFEITKHVFAAQEKYLTAIAAATRG